MDLQLLAAGAFLLLSALHWQSLFPMHVKSQLLLSRLLARVNSPQYIYCVHCNLLENEEEATGSELQARFEILHQATRGMFSIFPSLGL